MYATSDVDQRNQHVMKNISEEEARTLLATHQVDQSAQRNRVPDPRRIPIPSESSDHYTRYVPTENERNWIQTTLVSMSFMLLPRIRQFSEYKKKVRLEILRARCYLIGTIFLVAALSVSYYLMHHTDFFRKTDFQGSVL